MSVQRRADAALHCSSGDPRGPALSGDHVQQLRQRPQRLGRVPAGPRTQPAADAAEEAEDPGQGRRPPVFLVVVHLEGECAGRHSLDQLSTAASATGLPPLWRAPPPPPAGPGRDALEGKGPQRRPQERLDRRLEEVAKAVGGGYRRLQMPLSLALAVTGAVAGRRLGALEGGGGVPPPPSNAFLGPGTPARGTVACSWGTLYGDGP